MTPEGISGETAKVLAPDNRLYAFLDLAYLRPEELPSAAESLVRGGADLVEFRAKDHPIPEQEAMIRSFLPVLERAGIPLVINDHLELARAFPGCGLHIGQDDLDPATARHELGPDRILGLSTHSAAQAAAAVEQQDVLSYFAVGPVFPTATKPDYTAVGLELVRTVAATRPPLPFFAIGGINYSTLPSVLEAGARRVCVVSAILNAPDRSAACQELRSLLSSCLLPRLRARS